MAQGPALMSPEEPPNTTPNGKQMIVPYNRPNYSRPCGVSDSLELLNKQLQHTRKMTAQNQAMQDLTLLKEQGM